MALLTALAGGGALAGTLGSLFGGSNEIDLSEIQRSIDQEIGRIEKSYSGARLATRASAMQSLGEMNRQTASNLAGRGIYSSPVSEYSFGRNTQATQNALTSAMAGLYGQQAQDLSSLQRTMLQSMTSANVANTQARNQSSNALWGGLSGLSAALLPYALGSQSGGQNQASPFFSSGMNQPVNNAFPATRYGSIFDTRYTPSFNY